MAGQGRREGGRMNMGGGRVRGREALKKISSLSSSDCNDPDIFLSPNAPQEAVRLSELIFESVYFVKREKILHISCPHLVLILRYFLLVVSRSFNCIAFGCRVCKLLPRCVLLFVCYCVCKVLFFT